MDQAKLLETLKQLLEKYGEAEEDPTDPQFNGFALDPETYINMNKLGKDPRKGMGLEPEPETEPEPEAKGEVEPEYYGVKDALKSIGAKTKVFPNSPREVKQNVFEKTMTMFRDINTEDGGTSGKEG